MSQSYASSTGQAFTETGHLDAHFETNLEEYTALLHKVGLQPGWHVLDAGAGGGNFLPLIAERVGEGGRITALDLAPENVEVMRERLVAWELPCVVEAIEGSVLDLPFDDDRFDAVWCANTSQYLSDDEFDRALGEFRRVTKPGGLVAIKEIDGALLRLCPSNPAYLWRAHERVESWERFPGAWRGWNLQRFLEQVGLAGVWSEGSLIEHRAPLSDFARQSLSNFWSDMIARQLADQPDLEGEELQVWIDLRDNTPDSILNHPDFYSSEGQVLAVGRAPVGTDVTDDGSSAQ